jgi:hypothetical protein
VVVRPVDVRGGPAADPLGQVEAVGDLDHADR